MRVFSKSIIQQLASEIYQKKTICAHSVILPILLFLRGNSQILMSQKSHGHTTDCYYKLFPSNFVNFDLNFLNVFIWAMLGLHSCPEFPCLQCLGTAVCSGVLASLALDHVEREPDGHGSRAQLSHSMWTLPGPGIEPTSPALAGGFLTTEPSGKSEKSLSLKS